MKAGVGQRGGSGKEPWCMGVTLQCWDAGLFVGGGVSAVVHDTTMKENLMLLWNDDSSEGCCCCDVVCQSVNVLMFSTPLVLSALGSSQESEAPSSSTLFNIVQS